MKVVAVIPAYNEAINIKKILQITNEYVNYVIVVDDGSNDTTFSEASKLATHIIRNSSNKGYGHAVTQGVEKALEIGADYIITLDADGEHNPRDIPRLLLALQQKEASIVIGSRFVKGGYAKNMSLLKRVSNMISTLLIVIFYQVKISDSQSGFRIYQRKLFENKFNQTGMLFVTETLLFSIKSKGHLVEVPIVSSSCGTRLGRHSFSEILYYVLLIVRDRPNPVVT
jgi:glycosyltransferase involved in cell wall biosynthesis